MISDEINDLLNRSKLGFVATVSPNGKPNVSPKGTIICWSDKTLAFANIRSPDTIRNIRHQSDIEINVVDPILRRGFLFQGNARVISDGALFDEILTYYRSSGVRSKISDIVLVDVEVITEITSPLYDLGISEDEIASRWRQHYTNL